MPDWPKRNYCQLQIGRGTTHALLTVPTVANTRDEIIESFPLDNKVKHALVLLSAVRVEPPGDPAHVAQPKGTGLDLDALALQALGDAVPVVP